MPLPRLAIGAIIKNEAPYLLEWIAYHRVLGVERFFIADNGSTDGGSPLLAALDAAGLVRHLPFPDRPGERPQLPAYRAILAAHGHEADWIAFIDADEFLAPSSLDPARPSWTRCPGSSPGSAPTRASAQSWSTGRSTAPRAGSRPGRGW